MDYNSNYSCKCLMNNNYRTLFDKGRAYAAFNDCGDAKGEITARSCAKELGLNGIDEVLDPMAGYGTVMRYGKEYSFSSFLVEINLPTYLWQILISENYRKPIMQIVHELLNNKFKWPKSARTHEVSNNLIGPEGLYILIELFLMIKSISEKYVDSKSISEKIALSIILPFTMLLSTVQKGDTVHIKECGIAIIGKYEKDFEYYLDNILLLFLKNTGHDQMSFFEIKSPDILTYADSSTYEFNSKRFKGMLTSPPYPNGVDYKKMFLAENYFIKYLSEKRKLSFEIVNKNPIGTNVVKGRKIDFIKSKIANDFIQKLHEIKLTKSAKYDMQVYYIPYFQNYFFDLEQAYNNIAKSLANEFVGYLVISNNAIRRIEIPVSDFLIELWNDLGFEAKSIKNKDITHIGSKNPYSKGRMALHTEHIIKIWRNFNG